MAEMGREGLQKSREERSRKAMHLTDLLMENNEERMEKIHRPEEPYSPSVEAELVKKELVRD